MARTPSTMAPLGSVAADFSLPDPSGRIVSRDEFRDQPALLVMFLCNHCPFVKHIAKGLAEFGRDYAKSGLAIVAINSNDADSYPEDSPANMAIESKAAGYTFPYVFDATQQVARAYAAACTPDFFLYDRDRKLVYRGQFDDSRPENGSPVTGKDLRAAVDAVLAGKPVAANQRASVGCNIKWKVGR